MTIIVFSGKLSNMIRKTIILIIILFFTAIVGICNEYTEVDTLIIFDQSASMYEVFNGKFRINHAKKAVYDLMRNFSNKQTIGLRTVSVNPNLLPSRASKKQLCEATALRNKIRQNNIESIVNTVDAIVPIGMSPIELTLRKAILEDFYGNTNLKHIILITDGYENCGGDPCKFIKEIMINRDDIIIDIIAIGVDNSDALKLKCLSDTTKGKLYNIIMPTQIPTAVNNIIDKPSSPENNIKPNTPEQPSDNSLNPANNSNNGIIYKNYLLEFIE